MQQGDYIVDRRMVQLIRQICYERGATLTSYCDNWIFDIRKGDSVGRIFGYKFSLNNSASANLAQDKVGAYEVLEAAHIPAVPHRLLRTKVAELTIPEAWNEVVLKPLVGTSGHLVQAFASKSDVYAAIQQSSVEAWAISPRLDIVREARLIVLDGHVLLSYDKRPAQSTELKMFNLGMGATPKDITPTKTMVELAVVGQAALGLRICAVDIVETASGEQMILEVNDGIMMEYYSRFSKENDLRSYTVYDEIIGAMLNSSSSL
ncbi:ATP-grasp domain-containing protein [Candidatus Saccharibacteria bacterium]|nr:ATP-grasp domain-containing protein [Candidatus Saccharibacteria bacterium]